MEAGRARGNRDNPRLPSLSLGLSSVRLIVNNIEAQYARVVSSKFGNRDLAKYDPNIDQPYDYDYPLDASRAQVLARFVTNLGIAWSKCIPSVSIGNFGVIAVTAALCAPTMFSYLVIYPFCRLVFGTLYPAYASYKAVRTKNLKEYVKWMMYWIVFALFTCTETFTDVFLSWFPFYYEVKIVLVLWLLSPATKGSSILYRKFVHPALCRREQEIDEYIAKAKDQGYHTVLNLGTKGVNYATTVIMQTAIKGGGGLVQQLRKSYSLSDLTECEPLQRQDEADDVLAEPRVIRRTNKSGYNTRRSASESSRSLYFPEVDVDVKSAQSSRSDEPDFSHIKSTEDISSGYSSADNSSCLSRAGSTGARARPRLARTTVTTIKRPPAAEDDVIIEELHDYDAFEYSNMPPLVELPSSLYLSNTDPPFLYHYVGDQIRIVQVLGSPPIANNIPPRKDEKSVVLNEYDESLTESINTNVEKDITVNNEINNDNTFSKTLKNEHQILSIVNESQDIKPKEAVNIEINESSNIVVETTVDTSNTNLETKNITSTDNIPVVIENTIKAKDENVTNHFEDNINQEVKKNTSIKNITIVTEDTIKNKDENVINNFTETNDVKFSENTIEESTSVDTSSNFNDSGDSDDEASFGTPDNSPKSKRKSPKGKYGKGKAPPPPVTEIKKPEMLRFQETLDFGMTDIIKKTSQESLTDIVNNLPDLNTLESHKTLHAVNPIAQNKQRHKSKSPGRISKVSSSGIGKLLQLPGKLAFWNKTDDKSKDSTSTTSKNSSRRSSINDKSTNGTQLLSNIETYVYEKEDKISAEDQLSFKDAIDVDEIISHDILEKSDALQRLIDAKIESHPEYKFVPLQENIPSSSKSTDV